MYSCHHKYRWCPSIQRNRTPRPNFARWGFELRMRTTLKKTGENSWKRSHHVIIHVRKEVAEAAKHRFTRVIWLKSLIDDWLTRPLYSIRNFQPLKTTGDVGFQTSVVIVCAALSMQRPYHKDAPASITQRRTHRSGRTGTTEYKCTTRAKHGFYAQ